MSSHLLDSTLEATLAEPTAAKRTGTWRDDVYCPLFENGSLVEIVPTTGDGLTLDASADVLGQVEEAIRVQAERCNVLGSFRVVAEALGPFASTCLSGLDLVADDYPKHACRLYSLFGSHVHSLKALSLSLASERADCLVPLFATAPTHQLIQLFSGPALRVGDPGAQGRLLGLALQSEVSLEGPVVCQASMEVVHEQHRALCNLTMPEEACKESQSAARLDDGGELSTYFADTSNDGYRLLACRARLTLDPRSEQLGRHVSGLISGLDRRWLARECPWAEYEEVREGLHGIVSRIGGRDDEYNI